jgi:hypothetical protein
MRKLLSTITAALTASCIAGGVAFSFGIPLISGPIQPASLLEGLNYIINNAKAYYGMVAALPGPIASTATTAEQVFATTVIPTGSFTGPGQTLIIRCAGITANNAHTKAANLYFGAEEISATSIGTNNSWELEMTVTQATATATANSVIFARGTQGTTVVAPVATNDTSDNLSTGITTKCTGTQGTASAADMTMEDFIVFQEK